MFDAKAYWEERLEARFDVSGVGFQGVSEGYNNWLYRVRRRVFLRAIRRLPFDIDGARVLDVGSGTGFYVDCWKEAGASRVEGCDITEVAVERLSQTYPSCHFHRFDIGDPLLDSIEPGFDAISAMDVFFHIVDDAKFKQALRNTFSLIRPGGAFIWTDNFLHGSERREEHIVHRSLSGTLATLEDVGFEILDRNPNFFVMNQPIDSDNRFLHKLWSWIRRADSHGETMGAWVGRILYPVELCLTSLARESPTTEIMICRRPFDAS